MTKQTLTGLTWLTPILATLTAVLDAGHLTHIIGSEVSVLILAIITAIVGFVAAMSKENEPEQVEQLKGPQPTQQQPQPQKK